MLQVSVELFQARSNLVTFERKQISHYLLTEKQSPCT